MPKYFMHLRDGSDEVLDPEGIILPADGVVGAALLAARDCMAGDIKEGRVDLGFRIDVHADDGSVVHSVRFADAVEFVRSE
jgi:hypothetical protein